MKKISLIFLVLLAVLSCKKNKFKVKTFLPNLYEFKIEPEIKNVVSETDNIVEKWGEINQNSIELGDLNIYRIMYENYLNEAYSILLYNFGDISKIYVYNRFYKASIDTIQVIEAYTSNTVFSAEAVQSQNNKTKGIAAIEYLLYNVNANDSILTSQNYRNYIQYQLKALSLEVSNIQVSWSVYQGNFESMVDEGVEGSYNVLVNRIIHVLEDLVIKKIGTPLVQVGYYNHSQLTFIKSSIQSAYTIFKGEGTEQFNSIYNHIRKKNKKIANQLNADWEILIEYGTNLEADYNYYFNSDQEKLRTYLDKIKGLIIKLKVDVPPLIGISLTFGELDGD